jgi:amino acid transporter
MVPSSQRLAAVLNFPMQVFPGQLLQQYANHTQLNYFFKLPKYLATCLFGISFIVFGNTATNSVAFAVAVLQAAGATATAGKIVGIAIAVNTFSCLLHSMSRRWGIRLNNLLGSLKLLVLVVMVIFGFVWLDTSVSNANFKTTTSFSKTEKTPTGVYRYAEALVYVTFPFGGFHQANYVSGQGFRN